MGRERGRRGEESGVYEQGGERSTWVGREGGKERRVECMGSKGIAVLFQVQS